MSLPNPGNVNSDSSLVGTPRDIPLINEIPIPKVSGDEFVRLLNTIDDALCQLQTQVLNIFIEGEVSRRSSG